MKSLPFFSLLILCAFFSYEEAVAQKDTVVARVVYTNSERTAILAKTLGAKRPDTLFQTATDKAGRTVTVKNLSVLASTRDGKSLMIGGKAIFKTPIGSIDSAWAIARIDSPFTNTGGIISLTPPYTLGGARILKVITSTQSIDPFLKFLPLGVLTPDETEWYATPVKSAPGSGQQWFFHGKFDGSGLVDSVYVHDANPDAAALAGYHMSNLATSDDGKTMLAFVFDQCMTSDKPRAQLFRWTPTTGVGTFGFLADKIQTVPNFRTGGNIDTCFGFLFRVIPNQPNPTAEIALAPNTTGDLTMYSFRWNAGSSIALTANPARKILRSRLPNGLHFFTGITGSPLTPDDDKEVITPFEGAPNGNGGDMMFSPGGDSVVFVTCRGDDYATAAESGVYIYDLRTDAVTLIQNDPLKMERQPILTAGAIHKYVPPPYKDGTAFMDVPTLDFGTHFDDGSDDVIIPATLRDTTSSLVNVISATITGADMAHFSLSPNPAPATVLGHSSLAFPVKFAPNAPRSFTAVLEIHYQDSAKKAESDSVLRVTLNGTGKDKPSGGVKSTSPLFDLSVVPNPFSSSTLVTLTAKQAGPASLEVRDLLGKEIFSSKRFALGVGEKYSFSLDAHSLGLSPGEYLLLIQSGGDEVTRKIIYVK